MPEKPSSNEEEYFLKQEKDKLEAHRAEAAKRKAAEDSEARKALHWMHCPKCGNDLHAEQYHGLTVDRCGSCRGVWFDAGEVESLVERDVGAIGSFFGDVLKGLGGRKRS